jgi:lysyl-tRNA synthetase, class II
MSEEKLIEVRKQKHNTLNSRTYPITNSGVDVSLVLDVFNNSKVKTSLDPVELGSVYTIHGRILTMRKTGALTFITLRDATGTIQLIAKRSVTVGYDDDLKLLDLGDIIQVSGHACMSKTNEKSFLLVMLKLLSKAVRPPPEKWFGISDTELKHRKPYLNLMSSDSAITTVRVKSLILKHLRSVLDEKGFIEVETPTLNIRASGANAKPFVTHHNTLDMELSLRVAPELYLKRLVVGGLDKVYEIGRCYRNEGLSTRHNPEFTMLEFYQAYSNIDNLIIDSMKMLQHLVSSVDWMLRGVESYEKMRSERTFTFNTWEMLSMKKAVQNAAIKLGVVYDDDISNVELIETVDMSAPGRRAKVDWKDFFHSLNECSTSGQKLAIMFEKLAEPFLVEDYRSHDGKYSLPVLVRDYPIEISPLARESDYNPGFCDRFELFVNGRELCNAFQELNDPEEQSDRFFDQLKNNEKDPMVFDNDYIEALEHGLPPTVGFGIGIDRLVMLLTNSTSIKDVILFPTLKIK